MGKKNRKEFGQNPFSALKGFSASAAKPKLPATEQEKPVQVVPAQETDFDAAMDWLGVRRLSDTDTGTEPPGNEPPLVLVTPAPPSDEDEAFRLALGGMQPAFRDELPDEPVQAAPRLARLVRRGELRPEATLDLHGVTREQLRDKLRWFIEDGRHHGRRLLLVVTGRGRSSDGNPVLRGEVERYLRNEASAWVAEWDRAPGRYGGEGALLVLLKGKVAR